LPCVKRKARERLADLIDPDRALREAARLAYSDVRALYDEQGKLKPVKDWPDDLAAAIGGVEFVRRNVEGGDGHQDDVIKVKVWDKPKALEMLFKHMGLLIERSEVTIKGSIEEKLRAGRERVRNGKPAHTD
jgi:phage terminase small subunit